MKSPYLFILNVTVYIYGGLTFMAFMVLQGMKNAGFGHGPLNSNVKKACREVGFPMH